MTTLPVMTLVGTDATDQAVVACNVAWDNPGWAVVTVSMDANEGSISWQVSDASGPQDSGCETMGHPCLSCALREVLLPMLMELARRGTWSGLCVNLPPGCEPLPLLSGLTGEGPYEDVLPTLMHAAACVAVVSGADVCDTVFDDVPLTSIGLALFDEDPRGLADAVIAQIEVADVVVTVQESLDQADSELLAHLTRPEALVQNGVHTAPTHTWASGSFEITEARTHLSPMTRQAYPDHGELVTVELTSWKPLHPERLLADLGHLTCGDIRTYGVVWLPGRPEDPIVVDACGGSVSIGCIGAWEDRQPVTRLLCTTDPEHAAEVATVFKRCLMSDAEMMDALTAWDGKADGFEDWLGSVPARR